MNVQDICAAMKNRGGFEGDYEEALNTINHFNMEVLYQLADGFTVDLGFCTIYPNIGGTFKSEKEAHDHKKHPITFRFRSRKPLRDLRDQIGVIIEGFADVQGYIAEFLDVDSDTVNETISGGEQFVISGHRIKVAGENPACGVYFESVEDANQRIKVKAPLAENTAVKLIGVCPVLVAPRNYRVVIITQYSSGSTLLKEPRTITSNFTLETAK